MISLQATKPITDPFVVLMIYLPIYPVVKKISERYETYSRGRIHGNSSELNALYSHNIAGILN